MNAAELLSKYNTLDQEFTRALKGSGNRSANIIAKEGNALAEVIMKEYGNLPSLKLHVKKVFKKGEY